MSIMYTITWLVVSVSWIYFIYASPNFLHAHARFTFFLFSGVELIIVVSFIRLVMSSTLIIEPYKMCHIFKLLENIGYTHSIHALLDTKMEATK